MADEQVSAADVRDEIAKRTRRLEQGSAAPNVAPGALAVWHKPDGSVAIVTATPDGKKYSVSMSRV